MKSKFAIAILALSLFSHCTYLFPEAGSKQAKTPKELYTECMNTFSDDAKCKEFVLKAIPDADLRLLGPEPELAPADLSKVAIREELTKKLLYQNKLFVKNLLGPPDEQRTVNNWAPGMEEWIYKRPVSKYAEGSRPDKEFRIRFQRGSVVSVSHIQPDPLR